MQFIASIWIAFAVTTTMIYGQASSSSYEDAFSDSSSTEDAQVGFYTAVSDSSVKAPTYIASIRVTATDQTYCSGVLIASKYVLTSALCAPRQYFVDTAITGTDSQYVAIGTQASSGSDGQQFKVVGWTKHPKFTTPRFEYNFMLLELEKASTKTPVTLAPASGQSVVYNESATALGWGAVQLSMGPASTMQKTNMTVVKNTACNVTETVYDSSNVCAMAPVGTGMLERDSCRVDVGSPLIKSKGGVDYVVGVVSYGYSCGRKDVPTVFSRVDKVRAWIKQVAGV